MANTRAKGKFMPFSSEHRNIVKGVNLVTLREHYLLVCIVLFSLVLRLLWLKTVIEGDEGIYGYNAMLWLQGHLPYVDLTPTYSKMPLLYLLYLVPIYFFGNTIIPVRIMNNILFLVSLIVLYLIAKDWYGKKAGLVAALFYGVFMNMPVFQAQQAMSESLSVPFVISSVYFCNKYLRSGSKSRLFISGILISAALLIRQTQAVGIFVLLFILLFFSKDLFLVGSENKLNLGRTLTINVFALFLGILLPALLFGVYFWSHGALDALMECTLVFPSANYFSRPDVPFSVKFLIITEGLPLWLFSIFGFLICILRRSKRDMFLMSWALLFLPIVIMPPSFGHHYVMVIPQASILSAISLVLISNNVIKLKSVRKFFRDYEQNVATIFVILILILSFAPPIFLQAEQYPDLGINLGFVTWGCTGDPAPWTYEKQLELGNYLKSNVSESGQIFIYGWVATPYWLSGHRAPTKYIWALEIPGVFSIPEEEFQRLTDMVRNGIFECVIIFAKDLKRLEWRRDADPVIEYDPIVDYTVQRYFYVKNVTNAQIFNKYNTDRECIEYLFMEHFPDALKKYKFRNGTIGDTEKDFEKQPTLIPEVSKSRMNISGDARDAIRQVPIPSAESYIRYNNVPVSPNSKLRFGIATDPTSWDRRRGDGVQFKIYIEDDGKVETLLSEYINPKENITERKWNDCEVDLSRFGNRNINIIFVTTPGPANDIYDDWAYWSAPKIYVKSE